MKALAGCRVFLICTLIATALIASSCSSKLSDATDASKLAIKRYLNGKNIYDRSDVPYDPAPSTINGYYDIIGGAYRYVTNEDRDDRNLERAIAPGDNISFYFEAYVFTSSYESSLPYFTNIRDRIVYIGNNNPEFNVDGWSTDPLEIKVTEDPKILKSIQNALPSCRVGDEVRIFLPPNVAYGNKDDGVVLGGSTLVFILSNIVIIE